METTPIAGRYSTPEETSQVAQAIYLSSVRKLSRHDAKCLSDALTNLEHRLKTETWPGEGGDTELAKVLGNLFKKYKRADSKPAPKYQRKTKKG